MFLVKASFSSLELADLPRGHEKRNCLRDIAENYVVNGVNTPINCNFLQMVYFIVNYRQFINLVSCEGRFYL